MPEDVPGSEESPVGLVPDDEGKHSPELLEQLLTVFLIAVEENFGVGVGFEEVAFFQKILPEVLIVVDLCR